MLFSEPAITPTSSFDLTLNLTVRSPFPNFSISEESATSGLEIDVDTKKIMTATITTATRAMIIIISKNGLLIPNLFIGIYSERPYCRYFDLHRSEYIVRI